MKFNFIFIIKIILYEFSSIFHILLNFYSLSNIKPMLKLVIKNVKVKKKDGFRQLIDVL